MFGYYSLFIFSSVISVFNSAFLMKKYQLLAGTDLYANVVYMIINGIVSAIVPAIALIVQGESFQATPYSLFIALITVLVAASNIIAMLKAFEIGQVAIVNVFSVVGGIVISCIYGLLFLDESLTIGQTLAIIVILVSVLLITIKPYQDKSKKSNKKFYMLLALIFLASGFTSVFTKMHQVEQNFATVNTLSFSIWIGIIRVIVFAFAIPYLIRCRRKPQGSTKAMIGYGAASSVISGSCYIVTLITSVVLPITITSPISTGISVGLSAVLVWFTYHEKLKKQEIAGIILCIIGIFMFSWA